MEASPEIISLDYDQTNDTYFNNHSARDVNHKEGFAARDRNRHKRLHRIAVSRPNQGKSSPHRRFNRTDVLEISKANPDRLKRRNPAMNST